MTYAARNELIVYDRAGVGNPTRNHGGHGRVDPQALFEHGMQVRELREGRQIDIFLVLECAADLVDESAVHGRVLQEVEGTSAQQGRGGLAPRQDQGRHSCLDLGLRHALLVVVSEDVGHEVRPVGLPLQAAVEPLHAQVEVLDPLLNETFGGRHRSEQGGKDGVVPHHPEE